MNQFVWLLFIIIMPIGLQAQTMDLEYMRLNYDKAVSDKELCSRLIEELETVKDNPVYLAYLGAMQTIWANHTRNPISKLRTFNRGKKNIENAVALNSDEIEIRFIRLSVQKNAPSFLGYYKQIRADEAYIDKHKHVIASPSLLRLVNKSN